MCGEHYTVPGISIVHVTRNDFDICVPAGSLEASLGLTNNLGRAEDITITAELGSQNSTEFSVSIAKPRLQGTSVGSQFQVAQQSRCLQQYSSCTEDTRKTAITLYR